MVKKFNVKKEVERNKKLVKELEELDPFAYQLVKSAKFPSIEKLNDLLEKLIYTLRDVQESSNDLAASDAETYNLEVVEGYAKVMDDFASRLGLSVKKQNGLNQ